MKNTIIRNGFLATLIAAILVLEGCGFRMRGSIDGDVNLPSTFVQGQDQYRGITPAIKRILKGSGVQLTEDPASAEVILKILGERQTRRVLSVSSSTGKVREYELNYQVDFSLDKKGGESLIEKQTISLVRDFTFDETAVIAKQNEENAIYKDMQSNAIRQVLQRVQFVMAKK